jgi:hypothetical protein
MTSWIEADPRSPHLDPVGGTRPGLERVHQPVASGGPVAKAVGISVS